MSRKVNLHRLPQHSVFLPYARKNHAQTSSPHYTSQQSNINRLPLGIHLHILNLINIVFPNARLHKLGIAGEKAINILQLKTFGLGKEEIHQRDPGGVQHGEDDVGAPANIVDCDWRDLYDQVVEDPI